MGRAVPLRETCDLKGDVIAVNLLSFNGVADGPDHDEELGVLLKDVQDGRGVLDKRHQTMGGKRRALVGCYDRL